MRLTQKNGHVPFRDVFRTTAFLEPEDHIHQKYMEKHPKLLASEPKDRRARSRRMGMGT